MTRLAMFVLAAASAWAPARADAPRLSEMRPIALKPGVTMIPAFAPDGRTGMIVLGWRGNGNAHGFDLALVLLPDGKGGWNVVRVEGQPGASGDGGRDVITDNPHTGEDNVRSFRFARGRVDGQPATLLLVATRDQSDGIPDPSLVTFDAYRLVIDPDVGTTPEHFSPILRDRSRIAFCNSNVALAQRFGLPLRTDDNHRGTSNGC